MSCLITLVISQKMVKYFSLTMQNDDLKVKIYVNCKRLIVVYCTKKGIGMCNLNSSCLFFGHAHTFTYEHSTSSISAPATGQ